MKIYYAVCVQIFLLCFFSSLTFAGDETKEIGLFRSHFSKGAHYQRKGNCKAAIVSYQSAKFHIDKAIQLVLDKMSFSISKKELTKLRKRAAVRNYLFFLMAEVFSRCKKRSQAYLFFYRFLKKALADNEKREARAIRTAQAQLKLLRPQIDISVPISFEVWPKSAWFSLHKEDRSVKMFSGGNAHWSLKLGTYQILIKSRFFRTLRSKLILSDPFSGPIHKVFRLKRIPEKWGRLTVMAMPSGVKVSFFAQSGKEFKGMAPFQAILKVGKVKVRLSREGYIPQEAIVQITPKARLIRHFRLRPESKLILKQK